MAAIYRYILNAPWGTSKTIAGTLFTYGVPIDYNSDQINLNEFVPDYLDRYVGGVLSNTNLSVPYVEPSKAELQKYGPIQGYTAAQLATMSANGELTPLSWYVTSDTKEVHWASTASLKYCMTPVPGGQQADSVVSNISASGIIHSGPCVVIGASIIASSSGVIALYDGLNTSGRLLTKSGGLAVSSGDVVLIAGAGSAELLNTGLYLNIVSGTVTINPLFSVE